MDCDHTVYCTVLPYVLRAQDSGFTIVVHTYTLWEAREQHKGSRLSRTFDTKGCSGYGNLAAGLTSSTAPERCRAIRESLATVSFKPTADSLIAEAEARRAGSE